MIVTRSSRIHAALAKLRGARGFCERLDADVRI